MRVKRFLGWHFVMMSAMFWSELTLTSVTCWFLTAWRAKKRLPEAWRFLRVRPMSCVMDMQGWLSSISGVGLCCFQPIRFAILRSQGPRARSAGKCTQRTVWGRAGKAGKGRTHAHQCQNVSGKLALVRVAVGSTAHAASTFTLCLARMCSFRPAATAAPSHTCGGQLQSFLDSNSHFSTRATFIRSCCSLVMPGGNLVGKASAAPTSSWMRLLRAKELQGRWVVTIGTTVSRVHKTTCFMNL